jgi:hypothetical protein
MLNIFMESFRCMKSFLPPFVHTVTIHKSRSIAMKNSRPSLSDPHIKIISLIRTRTHHICLSAPTPLCITAINKPSLPTYQPALPENTRARDYANNPKRRTGPIPKPSQVEKREEAPAHPSNFKVMVSSNHRRHQPIHLDNCLLYLLHPQYLYRIYICILHRSPALYPTSPSIRLLPCVSFRLLLFLRGKVFSVVGEQVHLQGNAG